MRVHKHYTLSEYITQKLAHRDEMVDVLSIITDNPI